MSQLPPPFLLESYLAAWEFSSDKPLVLLCSSDCESLPMKDLIDMASPLLRDTWNTLSLGYTEVSGRKDLREAIAETYETITCDKIATFSGAEEAIYASIHAILTPQDHVIVFTPCYQSLLSLPQYLHAEVTTIPLQEELGWSFDKMAFQNAIRGNTKAIIMNFPHNPTGAMISLDDIQWIIRCVKNTPQKPYIISDEVYRLMESEGVSPLPQICDLYEKGISIGVLSKSYGLPGLRIGWVASHDHTAIKKALEMKYYLSICSSAPSEVLALIALENRNTILNRTRKITQENLKKVDSLLEAMSDHLSWIRPKGGCTGFIKINNSQIDIEDFCKEARDKAGILLLPGTVYNVAQPYFRIGFGRKKFSEGLNQFYSFCKDYFRT